MAFVKIYIHFVWSTKNRQPFLESSELRRKVWEHIKENAKMKDIFIDTINGYQEHCHCLISLGIDQTISKVLQLLKGNHLIGLIKINYVNKSSNGKMSILQFPFPNRCLTKLESISKIRRIITKRKLLSRNITFGLRSMDFKKLRTNSLAKAKFSLVK